MTIEMRTKLHLGSARRILSAWLLGGLVMAGSHGALGQPGPGMGTVDPASVERALRMTDDVLQRAAEIVRATSNPQAAQLLPQALHTQENAWSVFREARAATGPLQQQRLKIALDFTRQARDMAMRIIGMGTRQDPHQDLRAQQLLDRAAMRLEQARQCIPDPPPQNAQRILDLARTLLDQARDAFHQQRFLVATDLAQRVIHMLDELCSGTPFLHGERILESTHQLLERAAPDIQASGDPAALALLEHARDLLARADEQRMAGHMEVAIGMAQQAKEQLLRAMRMTEHTPDPGGVDRVLQQTAEYIDGVARQVRVAGVPEAMTLMDRAVQHLERARDLRASGNLRMALAETRVARNLARRAGQLAGIHDL
jgi:tetratricopeptide (TPR) repeat protein